MSGHPIARVRLRDCDPQDVGPLWCGYVLTDAEANALGDALAAGHDAAVSAWSEERLRSLRNRRRAT